MTVEIAPGAARAFRGRGGLRALPATSGTLRLGPALLRLIPSPPTPAHPRVE